MKPVPLAISLEGFARVNHLEGPDFDTLSNRGCDADGLTEEARVRHDRIRDDALNG